MIVSLLLAGCMSENVESASRGIVRGTVSEAGAWPATVTLGGCTGTLITPRVVLTAAHCGTPSQVGFGSSNSSASWIDVIDRRRHPGTDIALLLLRDVGLAEPVPISRVSLTSEHVGQEVVIVGFGQTGEYNSDGGIKREGTTALHSYNTEEVVVGEPPSAHTCYGDSGGPYFIWWGDQMYVFGVTSYGTALCETGLAVGMRVDTNQVWIDAYVAENDPASCSEDGRCAPDCPAVDPDCCLDTDGICTDGCGPVLDPDCGSCEADGACVPDCEPVDPDCCDGTDGVCDEACGPSLDADCEEDDDPPDDDPPDDDPPDGDPPDDPPAGDDRGSGVVVGGCAVGAGSGPPAWCGLIALCLAARRRRDRMARGRQDAIAVQRSRGNEPPASGRYRSHD